MSETTVNETRYCQGCKNNYLNQHPPKCGELPKATSVTKTMYPYSAHFEDPVTIKTYNCYIRNYIAPFPRDLEIRQPKKA